jgi:hypothetical protein
MNNKLKTLIEIDRRIWAATKAYSTVSGKNLTVTLESLLREILTNRGYSIPLENEAEK